VIPWPRQTASLLTGTALLLGCDGVTSPRGISEPRFSLHACVLSDVWELGQCGTLSVAEDSSRPTGRRLALRVVVMPARRAPVADDPIFLLTGGPGMAATSMQRYANAVLGELRDTHDIVLIDQRGTGGSNPLDCDLYADGHRAQPYLDPMFPVERVRACGQRLAREVPLERYGTRDAVRDLDALRETLGAAQIDLYGVSYGSRVALEYMRAHPAHTRRAVLHGVVPPWVAITTGTAAAGERAASYAFALCALDATCHAAVPDPEGDVQTVLAALHRAPRPVTIWNWRRLQRERLMLTERGVAERLWAAAYSPSSFILLLPLVHRAAAGDAAPLARELAWQGQQRRTGRSEGMMLAVLCAEDVPRLRPADTLASEPALLGAPIERELIRACAVWPRGVALAPAEPLASSIPTLILAGAVDPVAPVEWAQATHGALPRSELVIDSAGGHGSFGDAERRALREFFARW
jgi:pimeloyl-ACP methyl ester carboxylesterase